MLNRYSLAKVKSVQHRIPRLLTQEILATKKMQTLQNMSLGMYSLASLDYYDPEYFESIFLNCIQSEQTPNMS